MLWHAHLGVRLIPSLRLSPARYSRVSRGEPQSLDVSLCESCALCQRVLPGTIALALPWLRKVSQWEHRLSDSNQLQASTHCASHPFS